MLRDRQELGQLEQRAAAADLRKAGRRRVRISRPPHQRGSLVIPSPGDGVTYSVEEVSAICHVAVSTVRNWIAGGLHVAGETVRLSALTMPRGRIAPDALVRFLARVNENIEVSLGRCGATPPNCPSRTAPPQYQGATSERGTVPRSEPAGGDATAHPGTPGPLD